MRVLSLALTLFFVMDPFGNLPVVLSLLAPLSPARRRRVIVRESCFALVLLVAGYLAGPRFIQLLGVDSVDLTICGGVVLGIIALRLVFPPEDKVGGKEIKDEPFIVPLAIPLMAGPSALATVMIMSAQSSAQPWVGLGMMALAWFAMAFLLFLGVALGGLIPTRLLMAMERLAGLLLSVIAIHMVMTGIRTYLVAGR
ncbi:MAG: rane protein [Holophagaceae bacterium]|nr:rane protein [Holophagaceae bacterium]